MGLKRPRDINYLDYLRYCRVNTSQKKAYNTEWIAKILPSLRESGLDILEHEYNRLDRAWKRDAAQIETFWSSLRSEEIEQADTLLNDERMLHLKQNAVEQLNVAVDYYTARTERSLGSKRSSALEDPPVTSLKFKSKKRSCTQASATRLDLPQTTIDLIHSPLRQPRFKFSTSNTLLLCSLESELSAGKIKHKASEGDRISEDIIDIFRSLKSDLPQTYYTFKTDDGEDTFVHNALHAVISTVFSDFKKKWANVSAEGSKERRKEDDREGLRPDLQVTVNDQTVLFMEVKPPSCTNELTYLADRWKLANLAKDELDASLQKHIRLPFVTTIQVFGHKMEIHTLSLHNGLYHFHQQFKVYVPRAWDDAGPLRTCLQALYSIQCFISDHNRLGSKTYGFHQPLNLRGPVPAQLNLILSNRVKLHRLSAE
ncbi:hypothetical protein BG004_002443, partial [Podila humilis]